MVESGAQLAVTPALGEGDIQNLHRHEAHTLSTIDALMKELDQISPRMTDDAAVSGSCHRLPYLDVNAGECGKGAERAVFSRNDIDGQGVQGARRECLWSSDRSGSILRGFQPSPA